MKKFILPSIVTLLLAIITITSTISPVSADIRAIEAIVAESFPAIVIYDYFPRNSMERFEGKERLGPCGANVASKDLQKCGYPTLDMDWHGLLKESIANMVSTPKSYSADRWENAPAIMAAYGVLQAGNNEALDRNEEFTFQFRRRTMRAIYQSEYLRDLAFRWAMPDVQEAFKKMPTEHQQGYFKIMEHADRYLDKFDLARETSYYEGLAVGKCYDPTWRKQYNMKLPAWFTDPDNQEGRSCVDLFTVFDTDGVESPYRKIEAFIFRRVNQDKIGPQTQQFWLRKVMVALK